jgi:cytochrome bd-type quinol oxidase subunit 1
MTACHRTKNAEYPRLTRFFGTLLVINVAAGVMTPAGPGVRVRVYQAWTYYAFCSACPPATSGRPRC